MKSISSGLAAHLAGEVTTLAYLVKLTRRDGFVLAVTLDHDEDIVFGGVTYKAAFGGTPSVVETSSALNVDNMTAQVALMLLGVQEKDIAAGLWDGCDVRVMRVNWADLSQGAENIKRATFGEISVGRGIANYEMRGITQHLQQTLGDLVTPACNADFGDARCGMSIGVYTVTGTAGAGNGWTIFVPDRTEPDGYYTGGKITFLSGANANLSQEVKSYSPGVVNLQEPFPYPFAEGDRYALLAGCDKSADTCQNKFGNIVRFRGFPKVPGDDQVWKSPS